MAQGGGREREALGRFVRHQSGYGTTVTTGKKQSQHKSSRFIKHPVAQGDTLTALALKYRVTVEMLKRENKLWNNDTLFLKEHVLIPVTPDNQDLVDPVAMVTVSVTERDRHRAATVTGATANGAPGGPGTHTLMHSGPAGSGKGDNALDFLTKYDSDIAKLKSSVAKMKTNAEFIEEMDAHNPLTFVARKGSNASQSSRRSVTLEPNGEPHSPVLVVRTRTQARIVQDSLEKNQRASDELFEL